MKERSATSILAEIGADMKMFVTAAALVSWCGLKPRNEESAGKIKSRRITHGNKYIRKTMIECAWGASRTRDCFYSRFSYIQTVLRRKNAMKVKVMSKRKCRHPHEIPLIVRPLSLWCQQPVLQID